MSNFNRLNVDYFNKKCDEELARLQKENPKSPVLQKNLEAFRSFIPRIDEAIYRSGYNVFDFMIDRQIFTLELQEELFSEFEFDLFNKVRVSEVVPLAIINSEKKEKVTNTGKHVSKEQKFKIYHDEYEFSNLPVIIKRWTEDNDSLRPNTFVMKISTEKNGTFDVSKVKHLQYATFVYEIGKGFYLSMRHSSKIQTEVINVMNNLNESFPSNIKFKQVGLSTFSGKFGVDYFALDKSLFRMVINRVPIAANNYFTFRNCMWISESYRGLSYQSQSKIDFRLGSIHQKFQITTKETDLNTRYEQNGIPYTFVPGVMHNSVKISEIDNYQDALLMKSIFHCALYMYSQPFYQWTNPQSNLLENVSYSTFHEHRLFVATGQRLPHVNFNVSIEPYRSFKITMDYMRQALKANKLKMLKIADPTFYERGVSAEISGVEHQPMLLIRTVDPNWEVEIQKFVYGDDFEKYQLIRYPFVLIGDDKPIVSVIPPYFIRSTKITNHKKTFIDLKPARDPYGNKETYHPYVISSSTRNHFSSRAGEDRDQAYQDLVDLSRPFLLEDRRTNASRENKDRSTFTPLKAGTQAEFFGKVKDYLTTNLKLDKKISMKIQGTHQSTCSLIEALVAFDLPRSLAIRKVLENNLISLTDLVKGPVREDIAKQSWVSASQEFYDLPLDRAKEIFLSDNQEITYEQYKTVLENYFQVSIMVITHYQREFYFEKPRAKFFHAPRPHDYFNEGVVIIRHRKDNALSRYEPIFIEGVKIESSSIRNILAKVNNFYRLGFSTGLSKSEDSLVVKSWAENPHFQVNPMTYFHPKVKFEKQILDGAGKLRGIVMKSLIMWTEPLHPLNDVEIFEMGDGSFNFHASFDYATVLQTLKEIVPYFKMNLLKYKTKRDYPILEGNEILGLQDSDTYEVEGVWLIIDRVKFYIAVQPLKIRISKFQIDDGSYFEISDSEAEFKKFDYLERLANIIVQIFQNMYVCWNYDDPYYFVDRYTYVDNDLQGQFYVNLNKISRRMPKPKVYTPDKFYKNGQQGRVDFDVYLEQLKETYGANLFTPDGRLIVDSEKSKSSLFHQAKLIQNLKQVYFLEDGHGLVQFTDSENNTKRITWIWKHLVDGVKPESDRLETSFINNVPKLKVLMEPRTYFKEFYVYSSDFEVQGPGQRVFMDRGELEDFYEYESYRSEFILHTKLEILEEYTGKTPLYYKNKQGHIFALQRVEAGDRSRALAVADVWMKKKVNLGFYAEPTQQKVMVRGVSSNGIFANSIPVDRLDGSEDAYIFIYSKEGLFSDPSKKNTFAALLKIDSSSKFPIRKDPSCEI